MLLTIYLLQIQWLGSILRCSSRIGGILMDFGMLSMVIDLMNYLWGFFGHMFGGED